jgi:hypothetical protein
MSILHLMKDLQKPLIYSYQVCIVKFAEMYHLALKVRQEQTWMEQGMFKSEHLPSKIEYSNEDKVKFWSFTN